MEQMRDSPNFRCAPLRHLGSLFELAGGGFLLCFGRVQGNGHRRQVLARAVVQIARDPAPLFILGTNQLR